MVSMVDFASSGTGSLQRVEEIMDSIKFEEFPQESFMLSVLSPKLEHY